MTSIFMGFVFVLAVVAFVFLRAFKEVDDDGIY